MSRVKKNVIQLFFLHVSNYIFPLITLPYLIRVLGIENFGLLAIAQAWIQYAIIFVDYGFNFSATRKVSLSADNQDEINQIYTRTMIAKFLLLLTAYVFIAGFCIYDDFSEFSVLILICSFSLIGTLLFPIWLFQGIEKMNGIIFSSIAAKVISLIFVFTLVRNENDIKLAGLVQASGLLISGIIALGYVVKYKVASFVRVDFKSVLLTLKDGFDLFISNLSISFYTTLNVIMIGFFTNANVAGHFAAADKLRTAAQGLLGPIQQAVFPRVSSLVHAGMGIGEVLHLYGYKFIAFGGAISFGILLFGYPVSLIYFGKGHELSSMMLLMLSPVPLLVSIGVVFGQWWLITKGITAVVRKTYIFAGVMHLTLAAVLIQFYSSYGVIIAISITELIVCCILVKKSYEQ